jgi:hypothetical protein
MLRDIGLGLLAGHFVARIIAHPLARIANLDYIQPAESCRGIITPSRVILFASGIVMPASACRS